MPSRSTTYAITAAHDQQQDTTTATAESLAFSSPVDKNYTKNYTKADMLICAEDLLVLHRNQMSGLRVDKH